MSGSIGDGHGPSESLRLRRVIHSPRRGTASAERRPPHLLGRVRPSRGIRVGCGWPAAAVRVQVRRSGGCQWRQVQVDDDNHDDRDHVVILFSRVDAFIMSRKSYVPGRDAARIISGLQDVASPMTKRHKKRSVSLFYFKLFKHVARKLDHIQVIRGQCEPV